MKDRCSFPAVVISDVRQDIPRFGSADDCSRDVADDYLRTMKVGHRSSIPNVAVKKEVHPLSAPSLYARAERAALAAFQAACAAEESPRQFMKLMDKAATGVFTTGGVPPKLARFYAMSVTADVLARTSKSE